ncbi:nucleotide sugar dehydrogenase [Albidovulum sediminicola]|uniref:UDP-glucose 6-dehydrogenase n=1 Tax=Albidovulum sediminicola TaxID=2984331 RepID=A0ABT2Z4P3_9RHOB|nr:nucleotide sugar dehydrogenase [Defluviimonas sp. WL0075]MCV2866051.1 nucleotide sugar dehydrogenase [Defluviimonas sp. WL0075]
MEVSILGAGYVGAVSAACLSDLGNRIVVADVNADKVARIGRGESPIIEAGLDELLKAGVDKGLLTSTTDVKQAVKSTKASIVCVGTPSRADGSLDLQYVKDVCETIGAALREVDHRHTVIMRSTMVPGSMRGLVIPTLEAASGLKAFEDFGLAIYPEFLREGTAIKDFFDAAITLYGVEEEETTEVLRAINKGLASSEVLTSLDAAEAVKYANNCWHAMKISFANEMGNIARAAGIDGIEVMRILCLDTRLNVSTAYMRPGFAFGGSCLPKDLRAIRALAASKGLPTPVFDAALAANELQVDHAAALVEEAGNAKVALLGLAFKDGTDDLRESPLIALARQLIAAGKQLSIYDSTIQEAFGKEEFKSYFDAAFPDLSTRFAASAQAAYDGADTIIFGRNDSAAMPFAEPALAEKAVVDLVRVRADLRTGGNYKGICW